MLSRKAEPMSTAVDDGPRCEANEKISVVLPDVAICQDCRRELFDSTSRRFRFPFMSCAECGPRFTILREPPFNRANTTMSVFRPCDSCRAELGGETGRQQANETIACPDCGPTLVAHGGTGELQATGGQALDAAVRFLRAGGVLAVKGLGGYSLVANASDAEAVRRLRRLDERPLSVLFPTLESIESLCVVSALERDALTSSPSPIVLLELRENRETELPAALSNTAGEPRASVALPSTALQCLLLADLEAPLAMTCGAGCGDSVCADYRQALDRFEGLAGIFLDHDLTITHAMPDSVVQVVSGRLQTLRAGRGHAPIRILLEDEIEVSDLVAVGGQRSNSVAASSRGLAVLGYHIGDLDALSVFDTFKTMVGTVANLCEARPERVIRDLHPDYLSSRYAEAAGLEAWCCQHHLAHVLSCVGEHGLTGPVLGVAWDGNGFGTDETLWGGEFIKVDGDSSACAAFFRPFRLPGGETAILEPRRAALGVLYEFLGHKMFGVDWLNPMKACTKRELKILSAMLYRGFNTPRTSSVCRLLDAVASLTGLRQISTFSAQASLELEAAWRDVSIGSSYKFRIESREGEPSLVDWEPTIRELVRDVNRKVSPGKVSAKFHNTLAEIVVEVATRVGERTVVLTGDTFENRLLTERTVERLEQEKFEVYLNQAVPPNDGGLALGQIVWGNRRATSES
jgi:hydrogenase maturation protein HypF